MMFEEPIEVVIREFNDRGLIWLLGSPINLRDFVRLVASEIADKLDFFRAERINRSFVPNNLHKQEADLLYKVPFRDGSGDVLIYLLIEQQTEPDRLMG